MPLANRDIFSVVFSRIYPVRLIIILIISVGLFSLFFWFVREKEKKASIIKIYRWIMGDFPLKLLLALLLVRVISIKSSLNISASVSLLLFYLSIIALYMVLKFVYDREPDFLTKLLRLHLITVSAVVLFGLLQLILSFFGIRLPGVLVGSTFVRIPATFYDANHLPPYLLTAFPAIFIYFFYAKKEYQKFFLGILLSFFALVLLFTFSRSGFLSFSAAFLILGLVFLKRCYWQKVLTVFSVFLFALVVIFLTSQTQLSIFKRLSSVFNIEDKSTVAHGLLAYGGLELLRESPIIGLGYGSFSEHFRRSAIGREHAIFDTAIEVRIPAHSIWLEVLVETGLLGFTIYLWFMFSVLEGGWLSLRRQKVKKNYLLHLALLSSMVGILISGLFYSYNLEFFWFFIFMVYFQSRRQLEFNSGGIQLVSEPDAEKVPWKFLLFLGVIALVGVSLVLYGLNLVPILPGDEGITAVAGRDMRAQWGYGIDLWWVPKYDGQILSSPPLPIWINAFWTFLFDFGTWVPRFLPALLAVLGLLSFFILSLSISGLEFSFLAMLFVLASPGFLNNVRFGRPYGFIFLFSSLTIFLVRGVVKERKYFLIPLMFLLSALSLVSYEGYFLLIFAVLGFFVYFGLIKNKKWLLPVPFLSLSCVPMISWWIILNRLAHFGPTDYVNFLDAKTVLVLYFLFLPILAFAVSKIFYFRFRFITSLILLIIILFSFYKSVTISGNVETITLINMRMALNRDGRVPLYTLSTTSSGASYYSQVPLIEVSLDELRQRFASDRQFFAIVDGNTLRNLRENEGFGFTSLTVSGGLVLIERPGKIE